MLFRPLISGYLADSVGLGKTYTALAVIKYYEGRNKNVLVLCPKKLKDNWMTFRGNLINNPLSADRLRYDVLFHTDLSRERGDSVMGLPLDRINLSNYDLVVIDESHNFRNGGSYTGEDEGDKENRYMKLLNRVIRPGVKTKVLMLSATPVNNRFYDLRNQLQLAYEGDPDQINEKLNTKSDIDTIFREAQKQFNIWSKLPFGSRNTDSLLSRLDYDFFEVLDSVTIARSRKQIQRNYDISEIGAFPERLKPISKRPSLTTLQRAINYREIYEQLMQLNLSVYTPTNYILPSRVAKYIDISDENASHLSRAGREEGIRRLMSINLLKRMESSVQAFRLTVRRIRTLVFETIQRIDDYRPGDIIALGDLTESDFDADDQNTDFFEPSKRYRIEFSDMDYLTWRRSLAEDLETMDLLIYMIDDITPQEDFKLQELLLTIRQKIDRPINPGNRKILIFTAFSDTAEYLYEHVGTFASKHFRINTALITGDVDRRTTIPRFPADMNRVLTCFSPLSKEKALIMPRDTNEIDILIATDCISEGQNLQDCDFVINYDIHWNPVRIIQRFGRIDRIGSRNKVIQLVNFWPDLELDEYINLKARVETRMRISVMTATGDDDYINLDENGDLAYRRAQLERLLTEVVDLEDMGSGISIMDLGLNEFRMDLLAYVKDHPALDRTPPGIHAVMHDEKPGVIFILKNINKAVNPKERNRIHPFYLVYVGWDGEVILNHLKPKDTLDLMRALTRGKTTPDIELCRAFNRETRDGRDMRNISQLLKAAVSSIVDNNAQGEVDSFFSGGQTAFLENPISGLDDFELICFLVVT